MEIAVVSGHVHLKGNGTEGSLDWKCDYIREYLYLCQQGNYLLFLPYICNYFKIYLE